MKRFFALLLSLSLFTLAACSSSSPPATNSTSPAVEPSESIAKPSSSVAEPEPTPNLLEVFLNIETTGEDGKPVFTINSNLPDETVLALELSLDDLSVDGQDDYFEQRELTISGGTATTEAFSNAGNSLAGDYSLSLMVLPSDQPAEVQKIIGEKGENLTGELVNKAGDSQYITASFPYHSPYGDTSAPAALSLESILLALEVDAATKFGDNYTISTDGNSIIENVWIDGVAIGASLASSGDTEQLAAWNTLAENMCSATREVQSVLNENGYDDKLFIMQVLNDMNTDNTLLTASLGIVTYDAVNGINMTSN